MYRIRRFGVIRTATVVAVGYAIAFAILLIPFLLITVASPGAAGDPTFGAFAPFLVLLLVVVLVIYPLLIWVLTALACLVYNLAARWVGGIEVEVERLMPPGAPGYYGSAPPYGPGPWGPTSPPPAASQYGRPADPVAAWGSPRPPSAYGGPTEPGDPSRSPQPPVSPPSVAPGHEDRPSGSDDRSTPDDRSG